MIRLLLPQTKFKENVFFAEPEFFDIFISLLAGDPKRPCPN